jgi:hypothetical protein
MHPAVGGARYRFTLHYWYPREDKTDVNAPSFLPERNGHVIAFLAPTHSPEVFGANLLVPASQAASNEIKSAARAVGR